MFDYPFKDDRSIGDQAVLWRRIPPSQIVPDDNADGWRVSSAAFHDSRDGSPLSVLLADVIAETGRTVDDILSPYTGYGLVALTAGQARQHAQGISRDPPVPEEPAHAFVFGRKSKAVKQARARRSVWIRCPK